jgi:FkbM family methyltransferase
MVAVLKSDSSVIFKNRMEVFASSLGFEYKTDTETLIVKAPGLHSVLKFYKGLSNGDILGVFVGQAYSFLPVKEKTVIDVGANIADSAIYFAVKGAKRVIALEPFLQNYEIAKKNILLNNLSDKIDILLAGCSSKSTHIIIDPDEKSNGLSHITPHSNGIMIPLFTLEDLVLRASSEQLVLKIDCEGCEYDSILSTPSEVLMNFSHIQIEYHHGYRDLKEKLEKSGFEVRIKPPLFEKSRVYNKGAYVGYIYATNTASVVCPK